jgi:phage shock protein A
LTLQRRHAIFLELEAVERQGAEVEREKQRLALTEQRLAIQIDALLTRRDVIAARYDAAEAQVRAGEALIGVTGELGDLDLAVDRAETETAHLKARAAALESLIASGTLATHLADADAVERELRAIATERAVDHDLAALKDELQLNSPPARDGPLPAGVKAP